jgi:hypothetical protein
LTFLEGCGPTTWHALFTFQQRSFPYSAPLQKRDL